jgi:tetraacyldisaccharide 4'-kinase
LSIFWERLWYPESQEGWGRRLALTPLTAASLLFGAAVRTRNTLYDFGLLSSRRVRDALVVSVGNLSVGGSGKTPAVIYLANLFARHGRMVAVLSRGYGRKSREEVVLSAESRPAAVMSGDEPLLISLRCPQAVVLVGADRGGLAERARRQYGAEVILLDDGMQHRRLERDIEIALVEDGGLGNGRMLPRGPLRESNSALDRADLLWIRVGRDGGDTPRLDLPGPPAVRVRYVPKSLISPSGEEYPLQQVLGQRFYAFAGLARPTRFLKTLEELSAKVVGSRWFADHHFFTGPELEQLQGEAKVSGAELLVTTEKDQVRLPTGFPAWAVRLEVQIAEGESGLLRLLGLQ